MSNTIISVNDNNYIFIMLKFTYLYSIFAPPSHIFTSSKGSLAENAQWEVPTYVQDVHQV